MLHNAGLQALLSLRMEELETVTSVVYWMKGSYVLKARSWSNTVDSKLDTAAVFPERWGRKYHYRENRCHVGLSVTRVTNCRARPHRAPQVRFHVSL